ncbi:hypothetical protein VIGAN_11091300 [Vigna angularis var. angularis]|uniref:Uncharacterized protein n=1 Tax=Vigna angularis var. angularis TaxID=157739 RepID=A0A0S3T8U7_PHAAN|nr:hypothetical protein VIGAN_11091300 [Vigna angularis var. angularis]
MSKEENLKKIQWISGWKPRQLDPPPLWHLIQRPPPKQPPASSNMAPAPPTRSLEMLQRWNRKHRQSNVSFNHCSSSCSASNFIFNHHLHMESVIS